MFLLVNAPNAITSSSSIVDSRPVNVIDLPTGDTACTHLEIKLPRLLFQNLPLPLVQLNELRFSYESISNLSMLAPSMFILFTAGRYTSFNLSDLGSTIDESLVPRASNTSNLGAFLRSSEPAKVDTPCNTSDFNAGQLIVIAVGLNCITSTLRLSALNSVKCEPAKLNASPNETKPNSPNDV